MLSGTRAHTKSYPYLAVAVNTGNGKRTGKEKEKGNEKGKGKEKQKSVSPTGADTDELPTVDSSKAHGTSKGRRKEKGKRVKVRLLTSVGCCL